MEETVIVKDREYRFKPMKAVQFLAIKNRISFESADRIEECFNELLERIEVKSKDTWLPVKEKGMEVYYPNGIENDLEAMEQIITFFLRKLKEVFTTSSESKEKTNSTLDK